MSDHKAVLVELVRRFNAREPIDVPRYFSPEFSLDQAGAGASRSGLAGARDMLDALYAMGAGIQLRILEMVEHGDLVAARWEITHSDPPRTVASMSMYRFVDGRILGDWGVSVAGRWAD